MHNNTLDKRKELIKGGIEFKPYFKDELLKDMIENTTDEDIEKFCEMLGLTRKPNSLDILIEHDKNSVERKKRLMRLEKEMLVDMVFDLENRNEFLLHNLSEVEKMYNKLKEDKE